MFLYKSICAVTERSTYTCSCINLFVPQLKAQLTCSGINLFVPQLKSSACLTQHFPGQKAYIIVHIFIDFPGETFTFQKAIKQWKGYQVSCTVENNCLGI